MFCKKCGATIPDGYKYCMNCGAKADSSQPDITKEQDSPKKPLNKKILVSIFGIIVGFLIISGLIIKLSGPTEKDGYFANIPWGTDIETVKKEFDKAFNDDSLITDHNSVLGLISDYDGMNGVTATSSFNCENNKTLNKVSVIFTTDDGCQYTTNDIIDHIIEKNNKLFGAYDNSLGYLYTWQTPNSTIDLCMLTDELFIINYEP